MDAETLLTPADWEQVRSLALTSEEGFLFSRCTAPMTVSVLVSTSGLTTQEAMPLLKRLVEKGALRSDGGATVPIPNRVPVEEVDLDVDFQKEILRRYDTLGQTSHWRFLGVGIEATPAQVRSAYLELSKKFHPDVHFRKKLGSYGPMLDAIFQRLKLAWDTLSDPALRKRYEREGKGFTDEEKLALANLEINRLEAERRARANRERLLRVKGFARLTRAREEMKAGDRALADGEIAEAVTRYELALELDPRLQEAQARLQEAQRVGQVRRADRVFEQAMREEKAGELKAAIGLLMDAARLDPMSARIEVALGRLMYRENPNSFRAARARVARGLELGDRSGSTYLLHAELLIEQGLKKLARQQLELAAAAGEEKAAQVLLKKC